MLMIKGLNNNSKDQKRGYSKKQKRSSSKRQKDDTKKNTKKFMKYKLCVKLTSVLRRLDSLRLSLSSPSSSTLVPSYSFNKINK